MGFEGIDRRLLFIFQNRVLVVRAVVVFLEKHVQKCVGYNYNCKLSAVYV